MGNFPGNVVAEAARVSIEEVIPEYEEHREASWEEQEGWEEDAEMRAAWREAAGCGLDNAALCIED